MAAACNEDCLIWKLQNNYYLRFQEALNAGIVLVASAGNDGIDVDANRYEPCVIPGVICVGALESYLNTAKGMPITAQCGYLGVYRHCCHA